MFAFAGGDILNEANLHHGYHLVSKRGGRKHSHFGKTL
ncbi:hypothetical protein CEV33_2562 [Brucella grignonensis]|uniref:Uncharacterized protein n=1 Tax=Brucella grignonensis TaxID=94627 RepID=A0A256F8S4_9HYPH|nr:hypothetical protein CEV33_2562 [Brucella grignonensis]